MKQFIVLLATIPLMLLFLVQFSLDQVNNSKISMMSDIVYSYKEMAKQDGGFDIEGMKNELSEKLGVDYNRIIVEAPSKGSVLRIENDGTRGIMKYKVIVPFDNIVSGKKFLGIKDNNSYGYVIESAAPSEYLK